MDKLEESIMVFREIINLSWEKIEHLVRDKATDSLLSDWKQVNWELIVESNLENNHSIYLEPYAEGADFYGNSSRILKPEVLPTHVVCCYAEQCLKDRLTGHQVSFVGKGLPFECFVTVKNNWYYEEPPFDCVLVINNEQQFVVGIEEIKFVLNEI